MANPYGMVMGADGRWEYDPFEYQKSATNARFRTPFPYMGVGSLGAGLMTHSPLAGLGSEIPGIRGPGGAPAWGAQHGASPLYTAPSYSTTATSMVDPTFEPTAPFHFSDVMGHYDTGAVPGSLPMDITDTPFYSAVMGLPHANEFSAPAYQYSTEDLPMWQCHLLCVEGA